LWLLKNKLMVHWNWLVFEACVIFLLYKSFKSYKNPKYQKDYGDFTWFINFFWWIMFGFFIIAWAGYVWV